MRNIAIALLAAVLLSGCAAIAIEGGLAEGAIGAGEASLAGGMGATEIGAIAAPIEVSADLETLAYQRGTLSSWLADFARNGRNAYLEPGGILDANGRRLASIDSQSGIIRGRNGTAVGYINNIDGYIYEYVRNQSPQAVGVLEGWVRANGVELTTNLNGATGIQVLQPNVLLRVSEIENGRYLVTLPNGATAWVPSGAVTLMILGLEQQTQYCPSSGRGAIIRKSGEEVPFRACRQVDGAYVVDTPDGVLVVDAGDVDSVLTGDRVPGIDQMVYAYNEVPPPIVVADQGASPEPVQMARDESTAAPNLDESTQSAETTERVSQQEPASPSEPSEQQSADWSGLDERNF